MSPEPDWPWNVLGLPGLPGEEADIRRAYARALKKIDQARDIEGFTALREAFEMAMNIRAGRDAMNQARLERRAAKHAKPAEPENPTPEAPLPPPDPETIAAKAREEEFQRLVRRVEMENLMMPYAARLRLALEHPLSLDSEYEARIRALIVASLCQQRQRERMGEIDLFTILTTDILQDLDRRYGWLSDYAVFRRDFGNDPELMEALLELGKARAQPSAAPVKSWVILDWLNSLGVAAHLVIVIAGLAIVRGLIEAATDAAQTMANPWPVWILLALLLSPILFFAVVMFRDFGLYLWHTPARLFRWVNRKKMQIEDWIALRRRRRGSK